MLEAKLEKKTAKTLKPLLKLWGVAEDEAGEFTSQFIEKLRKAADEPDDDEVDEEVGKEEEAKDTSEQIDEAKKDIEEKGEDEQSEKDRVDESVGEQEELDGDEDSQDAKDRVDEAEGEKKAEEKHDNYEEAIADLKARIEALEQKLAEKERKPQEVDNVDQDKLEQMKKTYLN